MRFHVGFSFRPKQLLKWLIPILIAFGLLSVSDFVKADSRTDLIVPDVSDKNICDRPLSDYITFFNNYIGDKYNLLVSYDYNDNLSNSSYFTFYFVPNLYLNNYLYTAYQYESDSSVTFFRLGNQNDFTNDFFYFQTFTYRIFEDYNCDVVSFLDSPSAQNEFLSYVENYDINKYNTSNHNISGSNAQFLNSMSSHTYLDNGYAFLEFVQTEQFLYSNVDTIYKDEPPTWWAYYDSSEYSHYPTYINGSLLNDNQIIEPSYYPPVELNSINNKIGDTYIMTNKDNSSGLTITFNFFPDDSSFGQHNYPILNGSYGISSIGNDVYSFSELNCSLGSYSYSNNSDGSLTLTINGINCINIPSNIYQITTSISVISDDSKTYRVDKFSYNVSGLGQYDLSHYESDTTKIFGSVYLGYRNVSRDFKVFLSSSNQNSVQTSTTRCSTRWCYQIAYNISPFSETNPVYNDYSGNNDNNLLYGNFGLSINRGLLITNNVTQNQDTIDLDFFFPKDTKFYISQSGSDVCYFDGNTTQCTQVTIDFLGDSSSDDYDVDYYFSEVSDYIDSISSDMARFSQLVQSVYDSMPSSLSTFFFVIFILGNVFILLKLIKR